MTFAYDFDALNHALDRIIQGNLTPEANKWLAEVALAVRTKGDVSKFNAAFVMMPRKTGKNVLAITEESLDSVTKVRKDLSIRGWTADRLGRVWLLMQLVPVDKQKYFDRIESLFLSAEMAELVALYSALPVLAYPEMWKRRCAEGIRSNIGQVLEAVICNNPYPAEHLDELAWNQLVLKAIFTEKPILQITGLRERRNAALAASLIDYAHERWAAHRDVNPLLWICVAPFINSANFVDIQRLFKSENQAEREAAALACEESHYQPAEALLHQNRELKDKVDGGALRWEMIGG